MCHLSATSKRPGMTGTGAPVIEQLRCSDWSELGFSLGGEGALLLDAEGNVHRAPAVGGPAVNTVGAGDSMVAGFLAGIERGYDYALRLGVAAGGATAASRDLATGAEILRLMGG